MIFGPADYYMLSELVGLRILRSVTFERPVFGGLFLAGQGKWEHLENAKFCFLLVDNVL